jgi:hypothetical protein
VYTLTTRKRRTPTNFCFALRSTQNIKIFENTGDYVRYICVEKQDRLYDWVIAIRLAKNESTFHDFPEMFEDYPDVPARARAARKAAELAAQLQSETVVLNSGNSSNAVAGGVVPRKNSLKKNAVQPVIPSNSLLGNLIQQQQIHGSAGSKVHTSPNPLQTIGRRANQPALQLDTSRETTAANNIANTSKSPVTAAPMTNIQSPTVMKPLLSFPESAINYQQREWFPPGVQPPPTPNTATVQNHPFTGIAAEVGTLKRRKSEKRPHQQQQQTPDADSSRLERDERDRREELDRQWELEISETSKFMEEERGKFIANGGVFGNSALTGVNAGDIVGSPTVSDGGVMDKVQEARRERERERQRLRMKEEKSRREKAKLKEQEREKSKSSRKKREEEEGANNKAVDEDEDDLDDMPLGEAMSRSIGRGLLSPTNGGGAGVGTLPNFDPNGGATLARKPAKPSSSSKPQKSSHSHSHRRGEKEKDRARHHHRSDKKSPTTEGDKASKSKSKSSKSTRPGGGPLLSEKPLIDVSDSVNCRVCGCSELKLTHHHVGGVSVCSNW